MAEPPSPVGSPRWVRWMFAQWVRWCVRVLLLILLVVLLVVYLESDRSAAVPAAVAVVLLGIVLLTDWERRRVPRGIPLLTALLALALLSLQFTWVVSRLAAAPAVQSAVEAVSRAGLARAVAWGLVALGVCLLYLEKRRQRHGRFRPWEVEKFLPTARSWGLFGLGLACAGLTLLGLAGRPAAPGAFWLSMAMAGPLMAGVLLGAKRGFLTQVAAGLVCAWQVGAAVQEGRAPESAEWAFLVGFLAVPFVVSAFMGDRARPRIGRVLVALLVGVTTVYAMALGWLLVWGGVISKGTALDGALAGWAAGVVSLLPGHAAVILATAVLAYLLRMPTIARQRTAARHVVLGRVAQQDQAVEVLVLREVAQLLAEEEQRFVQRSDACENNPLAPRVLAEFGRLRETLSGRIFKLEQFLTDREQAEEDQRRVLPDRIRAFDARVKAARSGQPVVAGDNPEALAEQLADLRRQERDLEARIAACAQTVAEFQAQARPSYFRERLAEMFRLLRVFRPVLAPDTDEARPDVKTALDRVGQYFIAASGAQVSREEHPSPSQGEGRARVDGLHPHPGPLPGRERGAGAEGSLDKRHELAMTLKVQMEADYQKRAQEVAMLLKQADALAADLRDLRELWRAGAVGDAIWADQQRAFAGLLEETHRQIDLRRRVLAIYRRAEPPLDLA